MVENSDAEKVKKEGGGKHLCACQKSLRRVSIKLSEG